MSSYELEELIDEHGIINVLIMIGDICYEKAEYIYNMWQDEGLAKKWEKAGRLMRESVQKL